MEFQTPHSIRCQDKLLSLERPLVMGILNITPDSFFDGGQFNSIETAINQAQKMLQEGAGIIDLGAASSKPGSGLISSNEECDRLLPVLKELILQFPQAIFSVDTYNSATASAALNAGAHIINDISAGTIDKEMLAVVGAFKAPYIMMHMQGVPESMQDQPQYDFIVSEIKQYFALKIEEAYAAGITDIVLDPGFGFGKTVAHNFEILKYLEAFKTLNLPILAGLSRKSMIYKTLQTTPENALNGTSVLHTIALSKGAQILRVHDVAPAVECIQLMEALN